MRKSTMKVTREVVASISNLAQLQIDDEKMQENIESMSKILDLVEQMQSVDTSNVEPMANPLDAFQELRADEVTEQNQRELFQSIAPETENGLYLVPRVVD